MFSFAELLELELLELLELLFILTFSMHQNSGDSFISDLVIF